MLKHKHDFEVQGYELDSFNHVNNAVYLNYLESARWNFFKDYGYLEFMMSERIYPVVIEAHIKYIRELKIFNKCTIETVWDIESNYIIANHNIRNKDTGLKVAKSTVKMALVSEEKIIQDIPENLKNKIKKTI